MKKKKSVLLIILAIMLLTSFALSGCSNSENGSSNNNATNNEENNDADNNQSSDNDDESDENKDSLASPYSQLDLSEPYTVNVYQPGDAPQDLDRVITEINNIIEPDTNTSLKVNFIAWSDLSTKFSLILAGGEDVDIMFTAPWNYYYTEAPKGAFMEITDDYLQKAMPLTLESQVPESWDSVKINGKIYGVPKNNMSPEAKFLAIRDDLRIKYDLDPLTDWTSYENYLVTIAENETPESGIFGIAASEGNAELYRVWLQQYEVMDGTNAQIGPFAYLYNDGAIPEDDDFFVLMDSEIVRDFYKRMQYLREKGCWSQDALSGTVSDDDAFANGQGASIAWNGTVYSYGEQCEDNVEGAVVGYYDLTPDKIVNAENYSNAIMAIASASKEPERSGMVLDLLKNNIELYRLYVGGIEGVHYINVDDTHREKGPEADKFPWDGFGWGIRRDDLEPNDLDPRQVELDATFVPRMAIPPTNGFVFDSEPVKNEMAAINSVFDEFRPMLELGMLPADKVDSTIDEMMERVETSGMDVVKDEFFNQYHQWREDNNK